MSSSEVRIATIDISSDTKVSSVVTVAQYSKISLQIPSITGTVLDILGSADGANFYSVSSHTLTTSPTIIKVPDVAAFCWYLKIQTTTVQTADRIFKFCLKGD